MSVDFHPAFATYWLKMYITVGFLLPLVHNQPFL